MSSMIEEQLAFLKEIDKLKSVVRKSPLINQSRKENSAEHSWHLAMYALVLSEHANDHINPDRVIRMLLLHDIVEIDAGDHPLHESTNSDQQTTKEQEAAKRIFSILPTKQAQSLLRLWREFEEGVSNDAKFAKALDRLQPLIHNIETNGGTWKEANVRLPQVQQKYGVPIASGAKTLWDYAVKQVWRHFGR